ncbi:hypothetical protein B7486_04775 [cyanobacterium TDX16]|nr:hypothetical protein B7486_04775 [cyanobacterium TDX16]
MPLADDRPTPQSSAQGLVAARLTPESAASRTAESQIAASPSAGMGESVAPGRPLAPVTTLGSLGLSLVSHAIVAALFGLVTWSVGSIVRAAPPEIHAQIVAADVPAGSGGFRFPGSALIDRPDSATAAGAPAPAASLADLIANQTPPDAASLSASGTSLARLASRPISRTDLTGTGTGGDHGRGTGLGDRDLAGGGPVGSLWGVGEGQKARSIVYVMDRSGSMADTFKLLQRELMQAIGSLERDQEFNVIWFNEGDATLMFTKLVPATLENKRKVFDAIAAIIPSGQTQPLSAIQTALSYKPDVLFLLSDGDFGEQNRRITSTIKRKNKNRETIINTILFVYDTMGDGQRVLRSIAEDNGGVYKHVRQEDL